MKIIDQDAEDAAAYDRGFMAEHRRVLALNIECPDCEHSPTLHTVSGCMCTGDENRPCRCTLSLNDINEIHNPTEIEE